MKNSNTANHYAAERPTTGCSETGHAMERSTPTECLETGHTMWGSGKTGLSKAGRTTTMGCLEAHVAVAESTTPEAKAEQTWRAKYEPVERAIVEAHERRVESRRRNQRKRCRAVGDLMEATEGFAAVWRRENWTLSEMVEWADGDIWTLQCLARFVRMTATRRIDRLRHTIRRPSYYDAENARRRTRAAGRRIRRRTTLNPCPTREQILDAWLLVGKSHEATIRFGSLVADLECFLDNSLVFNDNGAIVGRRGGVKRWLQDNIPALYLRYTTVMRYKAAAQKLRRIAGLDDPVPAAVIVEPPSEDTSVVEPLSAESTDADTAAVEASNANNSGTIAMSDRQNMMDNHGANAVDDSRNVRAMGEKSIGLCCGRNEMWNAAQRDNQTEQNAEHGVNENQNEMAGNEMAKVVERIGLCCGRNQFVGVLDVYDETGGVDGQDRIDMVSGRDGTRGMDNCSWRNMKAYATAIARARVVWQEVVADMVGHGPTALVAQIDAHDRQDHPTENALT